MEYVDLGGWQKERKYETIREVGGNWKMSNPIGQTPKFGVTNYEHEGVVKLLSY